jgi:hypothetical protein
MAKQLSEQHMKIEIIEVNRETQEETLAETLQIDLSCLLFPSQPNFEFEWLYDCLKSLPLHHLKLHISCDQPMLSPFLRKKLNPCQVTVVAAKNIPYKLEPRYKPIHMVCNFVDDRKFKVDNRP